MMKCGISKFGPLSCHQCCNFLLEKLFLFSVEMNANDDWNASCSWPEEPELPSFDLELAKETISFIDNEKQFEKVISDVCVSYLKPSKVKSLMTIIE